MSEATRTVDGTVLPAAGTWNIDPVHSHIEFTVRHLVIGKTRGRFDTFTGTVEIADEPTASSVTLEIDAASINTKDENRDNHLRSADFLDTDTYPKLSFKSTSVTGKGSDWVLEGELTVHGVTKPVTVQLELDGVVEKDPWGFARAAYSGSAELDREDFGLTWNATMETGGLLVGKTVKLSLEVETVKQ